MYTNGPFTTESESEDGDDEGTGAAGSSHATSMAKLEISNGDSSGGMVRMELSADSTLGELFQALQADEVGVAVGSVGSAIFFAAGSDGMDSSLLSWMEFVQAVRVLPSDGRPRT